MMRNFWGVFVVVLMATILVSVKVNLETRTRTLEPIEEMTKRVTKKAFGTYVRPGNSPVDPEKFTGYHTAIDIEYGDVTGEVPVYAIADGVVLLSRFAAGYGGVVQIKHNISGQDYYIVYGHLRMSDMIKRGEKVKKGQKIGVLGDAYSNDTDNERKHLHFGISKTSNILGYVADERALSNWVDPLTFYDTLD